MAFATDDMNGISYLYGFGIFTFIFMIIKVLKGSYNFYAHFFGSSVDITKFGEWAIVTGCTDGIGKAIAHEIAKKGINTFLISRNLVKLKNVAKEIELLYKVETKVLVFDFTNFDPSSDTVDPYVTISDAVKDLDVGIMINNVGMTTGSLNVFHKCQKPGEPLSKLLSDVIHCNASSRMKMMEIVLPGMITRKRGLIANMSSLASILVPPFLSTYAATKRFDNTLSVSLAQEYKKHGVIIQSITPGFVETNMTKFLGTREQEQLIYPTAATYARHMMNTLGKSDSTDGYWAHCVSRCLATKLPEGVVSRFLFRTFMKLGKQK